MATTLLILLTIALSPFSTFADVSWSIDCGASASYTDSDGVTWQGDDTLISTGESPAVQITSPVFSTIRVFPSGEKNCYVLKGEKGAKLLVRASFLYGNYDGKSFPPSFYLFIDGNYWTTVRTYTTTLFYSFYEVIYISKGDSISVCLVQTNPNMYPFISALEVRTLGSEKYAFFGADTALLLAGRHAFGSLSKFAIRDGYDRLWLPRTLPRTEYASVVSAATSILTTTAYDKPPLAVVQNAITPSDSSARSMTFDLASLGSSPSLVYINLYFSEVNELDMTENRSFTVYLDDALLNPSGGITPPYGSVQEFIYTNNIASGSTTITLLSTSDSTLPPIINAMEVFKVILYNVYVTEPSSPPPGKYPPSGGSSPPTPPSPDGGSTPPSTTSPNTEQSTRSSGKKKSNRLPIILGAGIPVILLVVAFVAVLITMQQKRQRAAMAAAATAGGSIGLGAAYNNNDSDNGQEQITS